MFGEDYGFARGDDGNDRAMRRTLQTARRNITQDSARAGAVEMGTCKREICSCLLTGFGTLGNRNVLTMTTWQNEI